MRIYRVKRKKLITKLSLERMERFIGKAIKKDRIKKYLKKIRSKIEDQGDILILEAPSHRKI